MKEITDVLVNKYNFKLKGVGSLTFHLGCDFGRDPDGTLWFGPRKYVQCMIDPYVEMYGEKPRKYKSPSEKGDHPEIDDTPELSKDDAKRYQSMIGAAQWLISLARFDIATAVASLSCFHVAPREGHLRCLKQIYGYIRAYPHACIWVRTDEPDYSNLKEVEFDWMYSVYGDVQEQVPLDAPEPPGKPIITTTYVNANLYHCLLSG